MIEDIKKAHIRLSLHNGWYRVTIGNVGFVKAIVQVLSHGREVKIKVSNARVHPHVPLFFIWV